MGLQAAEQLVTELAAGRVGADFNSTQVQKELNIPTFLVYLFGIVIAEEEYQRWRNHKPAPKGQETQHHRQEARHQVQHPAQGLGQLQQGGGADGARGWDVPGPPAWPGGQTEQHPQLAEQPAAGCGAHQGGGQGQSSQVLSHSESLGAPAGGSQDVAGLLVAGGLHLSHRASPPACSELETKLQIKPS